MHMLVRLMGSHRSLRLCSFFFTFFFLFPRLDNLNWPTFKFATSLFCQLKFSVVPTWEFFTQLWYFSTAEFLLSSFYDFFLLIFSIWWDFIHMLFLSCLDMVSFSSLNIFIIAALNSLSDESNIWALSKSCAVSLTTRADRFWPCFFCLFPWSPR